MSYVDSLCFWSPTGKHVYQLADLDLDLDLGRGRRAVVDKCRHCGDLAFQPIQTARPNRRNDRWRPSHPDTGRAPPPVENPPDKPKQTGPSR